jgi:hypothetical protein
VAVPIALSNSGGSKGASPRPAPSPSVVPPGTPTAQATNPFTVLISWTQPSGGTRVESYSVFRSGTFQGTVQAPTTSYEDTTVTPGRTYTYTVKAEAGAGAVESSLVSVTIKVPTPPLSAARVEGDFNVKVKAVSTTGFSSYDDSFTLGWHFRPKCGTGACNVTWTDLAEKTLKAVLQRKGGTYSGSDSGHFNVKCGSVVTTTNVTIVFHVSKARGMEGEWRASRIDGTMTQDDAAQLGCVHSHAVLNITGTLLR